MSFNSSKISALQGATGETGAAGADGADGLIGDGNGDVVTVGSPSDSMVGVWTADNAMEGTSSFVFEGGTTSGITNTSDVGLRTRSTNGGGMIYGGTDTNHSILFRQGRDDASNVVDYHSYGSHRFYTGGHIQSQSNRMTITSDGAICTADGARLSLRTTDVNTYISAPSVNTMQFVTGDVARMSIDSGGDCQWNNTSGAAKMTWDASEASLGIRVVDPDSPLEVNVGVGSFRVNANDSGAQGGVQLSGVDENHSIYFRRGRDGTTDTMDFHEYSQFRFYTGGVLASQTEKMRITSDGDVGLGVVPSANLHVYQNDGTPATIKLENTNGDACTFTADDNILTIDAHDKLRLKTDGATAMTITSDGAICTADGARLSLRTTDVNTYISAPSANTMQFVTGDVARMRITSDGDVGLGVVPSANLHVYQSDGTPATIKLENTNGDACTFTADDNILTIDAHDKLVLKTDGASAMSITSGGDCQWNNVTGAPKMTWDASAAMLGIGTSVPAARLHVAGVSGTNNILSLVPDGYAGQLFGASISGVTNGFTVTNDASNNLIYSMLTGSQVQGFYQDAAGLVGIGTASPAEKMDCRGNIAINQYDLKFNESGVRSWTIGTAETSGALTLKAGDEVGKIILNTGRVTVKKSSNSEVTPLIDVGEAETIAVDFDDADNFSLTIDSDSGFVTTRILGNPSNLTAGQSGCIVITQDASEVGDLTYASNWHFEGGTAPELTQTVGAADTLVYYCPTAAIVQAVLLKDIKAAT